MSTRERFQALGRLVAQSVDVLEEDINMAGDYLVECFGIGGKVLICGNGGSAALAQHLAAELVGRFEIDRSGYPAIALTADTSVLTAIGNDTRYGNVFARQVATLHGGGDVLVAISTSGASENVRMAIEEANRLHIPVILLTGEWHAMPIERGVAICVPSDNTAEIQEIHQLVVHCLCARVEMMLEGALG